MDSIPSSPLSHQVSLFDESGVELPCVGTILSSYLILTLASCLYGKVENASTIRTQEVNNGQSSADDFDFYFEGDEQIRKIIRIINHPGFKTSSTKNDLAILVLGGDLNLGSTATILPIFPMFNPNKTHNESTFTNFSGFSCGEDPLEISHPVKCPYSSYKSDKMCLLPVNSNSNANSNSDETNSSGGNCSNPLPGSSLFCSDEERGGFLCGVLAISPENLGESPRIYTNITTHLKWIQSASAKARTNETSEEEEIEDEPQAEPDYQANDYELGATIYGGKTAKGPISYQLSLQYQEKPPHGPWKHICGAVVLDKGTAITAAHCLDQKSKDPSSFRVLAETSSLNDTSQAFQISRIIPHPYYKGFRHGNDIALLHVLQQTEFKLPPQNFWLSRFPTSQLTNMKALISGWGKTSNLNQVPDSLQIANTSILHPKDCSDHLIRSKIERTKGILCVNGFARTCAGDSGGPLVIQNYKIGNSIGDLLVGISSFGTTDCERNGTNSGFTEISHFYRWIQENRAGKVCGGVENMLPCMSTRKCYHKDWECDDHWDCSDGTDEIKCTRDSKQSQNNPCFGPACAVKLFATLNLPFSVMKQESFDLQVNVHNNLGRNVDVRVTLFNKHNNKHFSFVDNQKTTTAQETRRISAARNNVTVAHFVITPMVIGDIPIEVRVVTDDGTAADSIRGLLKVKSEGVQQNERQLFIFRKPKTATVNLSRETNFEIKFPPRMVRGGNAAQLTVVGDPIGIVTSNLGQLLPLPVASGEQNMLPFVSSTLALRYLSAVNSTATKIVQTAKKGLQKSFLHQLQYKKSDGSFSVWRDTTGTTWLTAYVLRWFLAAQEYITIDENIIQEAANFIKSKQQTDGSFLETGAFYHPRMGGRNDAKGIALTAFITLALIKANEIPNKGLNLTRAMQNGMNFISQKSAYDLDDNYITNLVAATLTAGNHPKKTRFFEKMEKRAKTATTPKQKINVKYWDTINEREGASGPLAIEMTSYALLAHLWRQGQKDSSVHFVYNWLLTQQNSQGGFKSTQDTIMGLTALTEFALKTKGTSRNEDELQLNIQGSSNSYTVNVTHWNRMDLQKSQLPVTTKKVHVHAKGSGAALIQMTESWHVPIKNGAPQFPQDYFKITAAMDPENLREANLTICVQSLGPSRAKGSVASIQLPTGYAFNAQDYEEDSDFMAKSPRNAQTFRLTDGNTGMDVYYNETPRHPPMCITFTAERIHEVANAKKRPIVVYEYSNPDNKAVISYESPHKISVCQLCERTGTCNGEEC